MPSLRRHHSRDNNRRPRLDSTETVSTEEDARNINRDIPSVQRSNWRTRLAHRHMTVSQVLAESTRPNQSYNR